VLTNLSLTTVAGLDNWVAAQLTAAGSTAAAKGAKLVSMLNDYAMMTADATYGASATSFNTKVSAALVLSQTEGNAGGAFATAGTAPASGGTFTLTTSTDVADTEASTRNSVSNPFKFSSGNETVSASIGTLNDADVLLDSSTADADVLNLTNGSGTFSATNIETINATFSSGSNPTLQLDNVSGTNTVNVSGNVAGTVDGFAAASTTTYAVNNITKVVTLSPTTFDGTVATEDAETLNVTVSGLSYGTTAATRSGVTIDTTDASTGVVLETLNITSAGTSANDFALAVGSTESLSTVNVLGSADVTIRVASDLVTGVAVSGATHTGSVSLMVDRAGKTTTDSSAQYWTGIDNIIVKDSTTPSVSGDGADLALLTSGQLVTLADDFNATVLSITGAATGTQTITVALDNETEETDTDVASLEIQNVESITINSLGYAEAEGTTPQNLIDSLVGDFTTITIGGDTSLNIDLNIDGAGTSGTTARAVTVNASTNTKFVDITAEASTYVSYTITGSAGNDSITGNALAGVLTGGAGNDSIVGGNANDTISGGDGNDVITSSYGTDAVTGGAGDDTFTIAATGVAAVTEKQTITVVETGTSVTAGTIVLRINGADISVAIPATTAADTATEVAGLIIAGIQGSADFASGNIVSAEETTTGVVTVTFKDTLGDIADIGVRTLGDQWTTAGDQTRDEVLGTTTDCFTITSADVSSYTGIVLRDTNMQITDFAAGDVLNISSVLAASKTYVEGGGSNGNVHVLTTAYATVAAAEDAVKAITSQTGAGFVVFLNTTSGYAEGFYDSATQTDGNLTSFEVALTGITTVEALALAFNENSFA
jgi:hypothetical protein